MEFPVKLLDMIWPSYQAKTAAGIPAEAVQEVIDEVIEEDEIEFSVENDGTVYTVSHERGRTYVRLDCDGESFDFYLGDLDKVVSLIFSVAALAKHRD